MLCDDANLLLSAKALEQFERDFPSADLVQGVQLFRAIRFLAQRINEATTTWLNPYGVSATKFNYLAVLYAHRHAVLSAGDLGAMVRTSSGSVTTMIDSLEREDLVARTGHPTDGRSVVMKLTTKGERLYLKSAAVHHAHLCSTLEALSTEKADKLLKLLIEAGNALQAVAPGKAIR